MPFQCGLFLIGPVILASCVILNQSETFIIHLGPVFLAKSYMLISLRARCARATVTVALDVHVSNNDSSLKCIAVAAEFLMYTAEVPTSQLSDV